MSGKGNQLTGEKEKNIGQKKKKKKKKENRGLKIKDWRREKSIKQESRNESTNLSHVTNFLLWDFCKKKNYPRSK